jgi:hypothetical protein
MWAGLTSAFSDINTFGKDGCAERDVYANFLEEASVVIDKPALRAVAAQFRHSVRAWDGLSAALLPDEVEPLRETRTLLLRRHALFLERGNAALDEIRQIDARLDAIKAEISTDFPLSDQEATALRENIAAHVLCIHDIEAEAVSALREAMA